MTEADTGVVRLQTRGTQDCWQQQEPRDVPSQSLRESMARWYADFGVELPEL